MVGILAALAVAVAPAAASPDEADYRYCQFLARNGYPNADCSMSKLVSLGSCQHFRDGRPLSDAVDTANVFSPDREYSSLIVAGALLFYCPELEAQVRQGEGY